MIIAEVNDKKFIMIVPEGDLSSQDYSNQNKFLAELQLQAKKVLKYKPSEKNIILNLKRVTKIDATTIREIMYLKQYLEKHQHIIHLRNIPHHVREILKILGVEKYFINIEYRERKIA